MNKRRLLYLLLAANFIACCIPARPNVSGNSRHQSGESHLELPAVNPGESITIHLGYTSSFNSVKMIPNWVAYELTAEELDGIISRPKNSPFQPDPDYKGRQPSRSDYSYSGWDKGHLAPCADMKWSEQAMLESFYFTNICPQNHGFNEGIWLKLEEQARRVAKKRGSVYVVCGPVVNNNEFGTIGSSNVVIPDAFFKAFLYKDTSGFHSIAYLIPNKNLNQSFNDYMLTVNDLEQLIGIDLFAGLNNNIEDIIEEQMHISDWN